MNRTVFRVIYDDAKEDIWADIAIDSSANLEELHLAIIASFDLSQFEMGSFYVSDTEWNQLDEIPQEAFDEKSKTMKDFTVADYKVSDRFLYVYDFLNMYTFYVEIQSEDQSDLPLEMLSKQGEVKPKSDPILDTGAAPSSDEPTLDDILNEDEFSSDPFLDTDIDLDSFENR